MKFLEEVGVVPSAMNPMVRHCDINGIVAQAKELRSRMKTKHIECNYHIVRWYVYKGFVKVLKIHMDLNVSNPMTKPPP